MSGRETAPERPRRKRIARIGATVGGVLLGLFALLYAVGSTLPEEHVTRVEASFAVPPAELFAKIADFASEPDWHPSLARVERAPDREGHEAWTEVLTSGERVTFVTLVSEPPTRLVRGFDDPDWPFRGEWEFHLSPEGGGTHLVLTERAGIANPIVRLLAHYGAGYDALIRSYVDRLKAATARPP